MLRAAALAASLTASVLVGGCSRGRDPGTVACTPGEPILVACASACGVGACSGDPVLRVCDGDVDVRACAAGLAAIGESDDGCGTLCPAARVTCPVAGRITVVHRAFGEGEYACDWSVASAASVTGAPLAERARADAGGP